MAHGTATLTTGGAISLSTTTTDGDFTFGGTNATDILTALGLDSTVTSVTHTAAAAAGTANITTTTQLSGTATGSNTVLSAPFAGGDTLTVNNQTITFATTGTTSTSATGGTINITTGTVNDILQAIDKITGSTGANAASITAGKITLHTGTTQDLSIASSNATALAALGLGTGVTQARTPGTGGLSGETLTIAATNPSLTATTITFGTGANQISTLNQLNTALAANDLQASIDSSGAISITTTNNAASETVGAISGTRYGNRFGVRRRDRRWCGSRCRSELAGHPRQPGRAVQQRAGSDQHHRSGLVLQRHQPVERRYPEPDVRRDRRFQAVDHRRHLQRCRPWSYATDSRAPTSWTATRPTPL